MSERQSLPANVRFDVLRRDDFRCRFCEGKPGNDRLHVDHLIPWSLGGSDHPDNLTTACDRCNIGKSARTLIPRAMLARPDVDSAGYVLWKQFGDWNVEVVEDGIIKGEIPVAGGRVDGPGVIVNHAPHRDYYWWPLHRSFEMDWAEHISHKNWGDEKTLSDLGDALDFCRRVSRPNFWKGEE